MTNHNSNVAEAFDAGRRAGLAVAAFSLALVSFLSLLGAEKALLAIVLATVALRGAKVGETTRRLALAAIGIGTIFVATVAFVVIAYWDKIRELIAALEKLS